MILIGQIQALSCLWLKNSGLFGPQAAKLHFRGQRIWKAAMEELMTRGMRHAKQVIVTDFLEMNFY